LKVLIFTEIGDHIGFGHVVRCSVLYEVFIEHGYEPEFVLNGVHKHYSVIGQMKHRFMDWTLIDQLDRLEISKSTVSIIDSYLADKPVYDFITRKSGTAIYIDDNMRIEYPKGIVLNPTIYGHSFSYPDREDVKYLTGEQYILLRKEFRMAQPIEIRDEIQRILVCLGGSNVKREISSIVDTLRRLDPDYRLSIITNDQLTLDMDTHNLSVYRNIQADQVVQLMSSCDLAISGGGQTLYELMKLGVPTIAYCVADNQRRNIDYLSSRGFVVEVDNLNLALVEALMRYKDLEYRRDISSRMVMTKIGGHISELVRWAGGNV